MTIISHLCCKKKKTQRITDCNDKEIEGQLKYKKETGKSRNRILYRKTKSFQQGTGWGRVGKGRIVLN